MYARTILQQAKLLHSVQLPQFVGGGGPGTVSTHSQQARRAWAAFGTKLETPSGWSSASLDFLQAWGDALYVYIEAMDNDQGNAEIFKTYLTNPVLNGAGYDDLLIRLDRWTNIQVAQVILSSLTPDVRKAVMTEVKLGGGGLECLRALYRPHLTDEAADLQTAKDTERVECYKSTKPAPQRHKLAQALID